MSEFVRKTNIGDTRHMWKHYAAGTSLSTNEGLREIVKDCWIQVTEKFDYEYPLSQSGKLAWRLSSWDFSTARADHPNPPKMKSPEPEPELAPVPWYRRWFGMGPKIPQARVVSE